MYVMAKHDKLKRINLRLNEDLYERAKYWAGSNPAIAVSFNDYVAEALEEKVAREAGKIPDVDNLVVDRLNQLIDVHTNLVGVIDNLSAVTTSGFDSMVSMSRGIDLSIDEDEGELNE